MCMFDGADEWKVTREEQRRARRVHRCNECHRDIEPGETYEYFTGYLDCWTTQKTCVQCVAARGWLIAVCRGWLYDMVGEDLEEHWQEHSYPVKTASLGKLIVGMRAKWMRKGVRLAPERIAAWAKCGSVLAKSAEREPRYGW